MDWTQVFVSTALTSPSGSAINGGAGSCGVPVLMFPAGFPTTLYVTMTSNTAPSGSGIGVNLWFYPISAGPNGLKSTPNVPIPIGQATDPFPVPIPPNTIGLMIVNTVGVDNDTYQVCNLSSQSTSNVQLQFTKPSGAHLGGDQVIIVISDVSTGATR